MKLETQIICDNFVVCAISVYFDFTLLVKQSVSPLRWRHNDALLFDSQINELPVQYIRICTNM